MTNGENNMKTICLVRHGAYSKADGFLTPDGKAEIKETGKLLAEKLNGLGEITVYYSPAFRTAESASEIVATLHSISKIKTNQICAEELACNNYKVGKLVDKINNTAIIISHQPDLESYLESMGIEAHLNSADFYELNKN